MTEYSLEWFQEKAFYSLKKIEDGVWDFSDSLLIYVPNAEEKYEAIQEIDNPYFHLVTEPEKKYIEKIAPKIAQSLPDEFDYIDLGPGTEHKEQFIFDELKKLNKKLHYVPVDIDEKYLSLAEHNAGSQGLLADGIHSTFEELPKKLRPNVPRFVSIGLTYTNYAPDNILPLLKLIAGPNGKIFINSQIRERVNMPDILNVYQDQVFALIEPKIQLLGLRASDLTQQWCDDEIRAWFIVNNVNQRLQSVGIKPGDKFLSYYFLRPSMNLLEQDIRKFFAQYEILDTQDSFVGALLSNN